MSNYERYLIAAKAAFDERVAYWAPEQFYDEDCRNVLIESILDAVLDEIQAPPTTEKEDVR